MNDSSNQSLWYFVFVILVVSNAVPWILLALQPRKALGFFRSGRTQVKDLSGAVGAAFSMQFSKTDHIRILRIVNYGRATVDVEDYVGTRIPRISFGSAIVNYAKVIEDVRLTGAHVTCDGNAVTLSPVMLNYGDTFLILVVIGNYDGHTIGSFSRIKGISQIEELTDRKLVRLIWLSRLGAILGFSAAVGYSAVSVGDLLLPPTHVQHIYLLGIAGILLLLATAIVAFVIVALFWTSFRYGQMSKNYLARLPSLQKADIKDVERWLNEE